MATAVQSAVLAPIRAGDLAIVGAWVLGKVACRVGHGAQLGGWCSRQRSSADTEPGLRLVPGMWLGHPAGAEAAAAGGPTLSRPR